VYSIREQSWEAVQKGDQLLGRCLGRNFAITHVLGHGMMGTVYEAMHLQLGRASAVKVLREDLVAQPAMRERFRREANAIARLSHPNLVTVYDYDVEDDGTSYIVMEFIRSRMLDEFVPYNDLSLSVCLHIMLQLLAALSEAHSHGVVHRDLKPENLAICHYVGQPYFVKVLDFGLAKLMEAQGGMQLTMAGEVLGTPLYMSPEQAIATGEITHATDIYAFGAMAYEMIAGKPPFDAPTSLAIMMQHVQEQVPPLKPREGTTASAELVQVVLRCLAKKPEERYPTALDVIRALEATPEVQGMYRNSEGIVFKRGGTSTETGQATATPSGGSVLGRVSGWFRR